MTTAAVVVLLALAGLVVIGLAIALLVLRLLLWIVLLPFKLLFWALALPLALLKAALLAVVAVVGGVVVIVGGLALALTAAVALVVPLLPLAFLVLVTWALVRLMKRPAHA